MDWMHASLGNPYNTAITPTMSTRFSHPMTFWQRLANTALSTFIVTRFSFAIREQDKYVENYFGPGYPNSFELQKDIDLVLANHHVSLHGNQALTPSIIPVAGIHISEDDSPLPKVQIFTF